MRNKVLVLGATGTVGLPTVKALLAKGETVKAASRGGLPVEGQEGVVFDYGKPETFDAAFEGVDRAFVLLPAGSVDPKGLVLPVIAFATARKVKVVFQQSHRPGGAVLCGRRFDPVGCHRKIRGLQPRR